VSIKPIAMFIAAALCGGGLLFAAVAIATIPLSIGGPGFGYKKLLLLLVGLEAAGCGVLLWKRLGGSRKSEVGSAK
jgi:hypothetical protein